MKLFFAAILLCLSVVSTGAEAPAPTPAKPEVFTPFKDLGVVRVWVDEDSFKSYHGKPDEAPVIGVTIKIDLATPVEFPAPPPRVDTVLIASYVNSLAVDCVRDRLFLLRSEALDPDGKSLMVHDEPVVIQNAHDKSPTSAVMDELICPPILDRYKMEEPKKKVTPHGDHDA